MCWRVTLRVCANTGIDCLTRRNYVRRFGLLSAGFGTGAVVGALAIPRQIMNRPLNKVVTLGVILWTLAIVLVAITHSTPIAIVGAFCAGVAWVTVFASLSTGTQSTAPAWVRARAVAMNIVAVQASLAIGSALWGALASVVGTSVALATSAALIVVLHLFNRRVRVEMGTEADVTPGVTLPELSIAVEPLPDDGPVLIQIEYRIDPPERATFLRAIQGTETIRRRNGATSWRVFRDLGEDGRFVERYIIASWAEYIRLRSRMTMADRSVLDQVEKSQRPDIPIRVSRLLGVTSFGNGADAHSS